MKKMLFTAIALVAFAGTSIVNAKEDLIRTKPCMQVYMETYDECADLGMDAADCTSEANAAYGECLSGN
ncbi:hypothetical protein [Flavobacterium terrae]|uniref:Cysteine rich repeat-containing protein n=1 Tax=Flavobacterium terrae TaxID=415425 RepID=A0A1M6DRE2_9FLAO|nr:hypothetical protein [Flavobacterium terrae]SHI75824.1 hypothetical protein SAMN05444363_1596 [Flavobacterium terrae]